MGIKIGVDGGGSKTAIVALSDSGQVLRSHLNPSSNYHVAGQLQAVQNIVGGIGTVLNDEPLEGIGISLAGIDTLADWKIIAQGVRQELLELAAKKGISFADVPVVLENDAFGALLSVRGRFSGNVLAVGTGTVALGVNQAGEACRVGGWGHQIGDQGSGYDIGRKALAGMVAANDGYGADTILGDLVTELLGLHQIREIVDWLNQSGRTNKDIAALVPLVAEAARQQDAVALNIFQEAGRDLGLVTCALLRKTSGEELGLVGGIVQAWEFIELSFWQTVKPEFPDLQILKPLYPPPVGAALLSQIPQVQHLKF